MRIILATLMLFVFIPSLSAAPDLENCNLISSRICVEADETREINGFPVYAACWKWKTVFACDREEVENECEVFEPYLQQHPSPLGCRKSSQSCAGVAEDGLCPRFEEGWRCTGEFSALGEDSFTDALFLSKVPTRFLKNQESSRIVLETPETPKEFRDACTQESSGLCVARGSRTCVKGAARHFLGGKVVERSCWGWEQNYTCRGRTREEHDCQAFIDNPDCEYVDAECLSYHGEDCVHETHTYLCGGKVKGTVDHSCGSQNWCLNGVCEDRPEPQANQGFGHAATMMNLLQEMGRDFTAEGNDVKVFTGKDQNCDKVIFGIKDCCKIKGWGVSLGLLECSESEEMLAIARQQGQSHKVRTYCSEKAFLGICLKRTTDFCTFNGRLPRILQEEARGQLGLGWSNCNGLTPEQLATIDWSEVDLSEVLVDIEANLSVPDTEKVKENVTNKIQTFWQSGQKGPLVEKADELEDVEIPALDDLKEDVEKEIRSLSPEDEEDE